MIGGRVLDTQSLTGSDEGRAVPEVAGIFGLESSSPNDGYLGLDSTNKHDYNFDDIRA